MQLANCNSSNKEANSKECDNVGRWLLVEQIRLAHLVLLYLRSGELEIINHRLLAFSQKESYFRRYESLARPLRYWILIVITPHCLSFNLLSQITFSKSHCPH